MRKDTEVHSGYYTEDGSALQPGSVREPMDILETARTDAGEEPRMRADARRSRAKLLEAATEAFAENGADAPLEDIARRAGVGIGTQYRHIPTRTDHQAAVYRSQVDAVCATADKLIGTASPAQVFTGSVRAIAAYLITKRGLSKALIDAVGRDSELISVCSLRMRETLDGVLSHAQEAGVLRPDVTSMDVLRLVHGIVMATEKAPEDTDRLLGMMLDGLRAQPSPA
jgi:AcrR family transcriptional regulator